MAVEPQREVEPELPPEAVLRAPVREAAGERADWSAGAPEGLTVAATLQLRAEPGAVLEEAQRAAVLEAVQQTAVLCGTVLQSTGGGNLGAEPGAVQQTAVLGAMLCGTRLQSTGGSNLEAGKAGQLVFTGSISSFFKKIFHFF